MQRHAQAATLVDDFFASGSAPILDLQAAQDTVAPRHLANFLQQSLGQRVTIEVIENAGHALIPEQPGEVCRALSAWVCRLHALTPVQGRPLSKPNNRDKK